MRMPNVVRVGLALALLALSLAAGAASFADKYLPGATYYFESFNSSLQPWTPGEDLNVEEVFKNYEYYEIVFDKSGQEITVNHYIQNNKADGAQYRILPNRGLQKK